VVQLSYFSDIWDRLPSRETQILQAILKGVQLVRGDDGAHYPLVLCRLPPAYLIGSSPAAMAARPLPIPTTASRHGLRIMQLSLDGIHHVGCRCCMLSVYMNFRKLGMRSKR
jgi:hypothetical protein